MKEYLLSVMGTVIVCAVLCSILPKGKTSSLVVSIARWVCVLSILSPIIEYFNGGKNSFFGEKSEEVFFSQSVIEKEGVFINYYSELRIRETERLLEREIFNRYGVDMEISIFYEEETGAENSQKIKITKIYGKVKEKINEEEVRVVWDYLTKNYCNEVLLE